MLQEIYKIEVLEGFIEIIIFLFLLLKQVSRFFDLKLPEFCKLHFQWFISLP